ncbi:MAG: YbaN family protein [Planctomycetota bacterium]|nr:YbaN family protein [Planctomycetota bacterium]
MTSERDNPDRVKISRNSLTRTLWFVLGGLFVGIGSIGVLLPGLPTTPFMLLAAACFARSSERFYNWLISNPLFGEGVRRYRAGHGIRPRVKFAAASLAGLSTSYSALFGIPAEHISLRVFVAAVGVFGVWFILSRQTDRGED